MSANSITINFQKMPTVTVDGKTQKFQTDKANAGFQPINEGGVTYSLVKDATSGRYKMTIEGEPAALEKYNFSVGKGRVTDGKFGAQSMESFFKGSSHVGAGKGEKHYGDFSFAGSHLKDKTSFLQSGAWGLDPLKAQEELKEEEAEAAAKKADSNPEAEKKPPADEAQVVVTSSQALSQTEIVALKSGIHENYYESLDKLVSKNDTASLREVQMALKKDNGREMAHRILSEKDDALLPKASSLSLAEYARKTEANLAKLGLKANHTEGDGNCFYHAVGNQLTLGQGIVRKQVALAMNDILRRPEYQELPKGLNGEKPTEQRFENTLLDASEAGDQAWGEDYHCAYVARAFDRPVVLVASDRIAVYEKDQEVAIIDSPSQLPKNAIILSHKGGNHWESASPIQP